MEHVTVGIDIGTTSVKAVAADGEGGVAARARIPHRVVSTDPGRFEHDPQEAWIDGVLGTWGEVTAGIDGRPVAAVTVSAMVPSMCGVDSAGTPVTPGLLYGDARGRAVGSSTEATGGEAAGFARWLAACDGVEALWPAQAAANRALCGVAAMDSSTAMAMTPMS